MRTGRTITGNIHRGAIAAGLLTLACGADRPVAAPTVYEVAIAQALGARFGVVVGVRCVTAAARCTATLPDATALPIALGADGSWRVDGLVVRAAALEAVIADELDGVGATARARCPGPAIRVIAEGARISCPLSGGGRAFVDVHADGSIDVELALDAAAGAARMAPLPGDPLGALSTGLGETAGSASDED